MMQQTSKLSGRSNGHATAAAAAAAKRLKTRTVQKEELIPGAVFAGKVRAVQAYGAFVDVRAFTDGLLHISQLSSNYVSQVQDVVSVGQEVIVRYVDVDEMAGRICLTMRDETKVAEDHQQTQTLKENQSGDASQGCQQEDAVSKRGKITGKKSRERGKRDEQKQKVYIVHSFSAGLICLFFASSLVGGLAAHSSSVKKIIIWLVFLVDFLVSYRSPLL
jgi:predicted RNA-binding protein with RPS1 domain